MIPLLIVPVVIYNIIAVFGVSMATPLIPVSPSITLSLSDAIIAVTLVLLSVEIWRSATPTPETAKNHAAGLVLLVLCIIELFGASWCATGLFLVLTLAALIDVIVGTFITFALKGKNIWVSNGR